MIRPVDMSQTVTPLTRFCEMVYSGLTGMRGSEVLVVQQLGP